MVRGTTIGITWPDETLSDAGQRLIERQAYSEARKFLKERLMDTNDQNEKNAILKRLGEVGAKIDALQ